MIRPKASWQVPALAAWAISCLVWNAWFASPVAAANLAGAGVDLKAVERPVAQRYAKLTEDETPDFRKHVIPLAGRLGCNGRACHGSFQGQGGFMLSLFGYDFENDHKQLLGEGDSGEPRVNTKEPAASLVLQKPTMQIHHDGGERMKADTWQYNLLLRWIQSGAPSVSDKTPEFVRLDVTPSEILFAKAGEKVQLNVVAVWSDGSREDVTCLCRFQSNDSQVAEIDEHGQVTASEPGDTHVVVFYDNGVQPIPVIRPVSDQHGPNYPEVPTPTKIDQLVVQKLSKLGIVPSELSNDGEFLRRVSLDLTGTLPTATEAQAFLADSSPDKRARKIDELLERPGYAAWWTTRLCDWTGNNADELVNATPVRATGSQEWYDWIYKRVAENKPYDQLVEGIVLATSRNPGENYREYCENLSKIYYGKDSKQTIADRDYLPHYWARRNFRQPNERVIGFAYSFLGIRIQCAECHKHPFDQWTKQDFDDFKAFFTQVRYGQDREQRREYNAILKELGIDGNLRNNQLRRELESLVSKGKTVPFQELHLVPLPGARRGATARLLGGDEVKLSATNDVRKPLMDWLRREDNPYFARAFVNRVWANYFNRGIVEPPDDLSLANPPTNKALLDYLTEGFIASGFDMKWVHREILNSRTYQLSWRPNDTNRLDEKNFSRAIPRRLPAEVAVDAVAMATASDAAAQRLVHDLNGRAIAMPGSGRRIAQRGPTYALTVFGRSVRESNCDCDRSMDASLLQTVYLQNDQEVLDMIVRRGSWVDQLGRDPAVRSEDAGDRQQLRRKVVELREQLADARRAQNRRRLVQLQREMRETQRMLAQAQEQPQQEARPVKIEPVEAVRQAYLRTLCREPSDAEMQTALDYIKGSPDPVSGVRDVLWSLLNTKEFIVNH